MRLILLGATFFFTITIPAFSQEVQLCFDSPLPKELKLSSCVSVKDSSAVWEHVRKVKKTLIESGYLSASVDSVTRYGSTSTAHLYLGEKYRWAILKSGNVPDEVLTQINFRPKLYNHTKFTPTQVSSLFSKVLAYAENHGHPFATVRLDSIQLIENSLVAALNYDKGQLVKIDTVIIKGSLEGNRQYILQYLNLKQGQLYDHRSILRIDTRLREIPFVQPLQPHDLAMRPGKAAVYLYLDKKKASNFTGILGVLPDPQTQDITLTGDIELNLMNALKRGETINFHWEKLPSKTQQLQIAVAYPYLFNLPVGVQLSLNLYRQDTIVSQVESNVGLEYLLTGGNKLGVFLRNESTNVLSSDFILSGEYRDTKTIMAGLNGFVSNLDYRFNPRKGYQLNTTLAAGKKTILKDPAVTDEVYAQGELSSDIYRLELQSRGFLPLFSRATVMGGVKSGYVINKNLYKNDLFRIGGLKTLRGFNEQSIYASLFAVATIEVRYLLEQNSNLFLFFDQGYYENALGQNTLSDNPYGFGAGVNFETAAGIFSLTYALGQQLNDPVDFRSGKVHFGFISLF